MSGRWAGTRFDGRSAAGEIVALTVDASTLVVISRAGCERHAVASLAIGETFRHAPVMIGLPEGATLEVPDPGRTLQAALAAAGHRKTRVGRLQERWPAALAALVVLIGTLALAYAVGLPLAARAIVAAMPADMERRLGEGVLQAMDRHTLRRSGLAPARRKAIENTFAQAAARAAPGVEARLAFRAGPPNAFALPGGTIVVLDGLVQLAATDDELVAALGHELGHVVHKHSTRQLVQGLGVVVM
ncbi:MAG TPA: M48 family metallopeptidase, partial [Casimicrobiaceae bacterium]|nr:M48 family metallopeptidase [Casimicrobiaceae bacterium]